MASYNIVLNLKGNSVSQVERLADALERANRNAKGLSDSLRGLNVPTPDGADGVFGSSTRSRVGSLAFNSQFSTGGGLNTTVSLIGRANAILGTAHVALNLISSVARGIILPVTKANYIWGVKGLNYAANMLTSSEMGEGIRLLQRRQQARIGFGESYASAQERADLLAASYGLDPSNTIAAMNVLTGLPIGTTGRRISMYDAERLTQAGGLISQQSGVPFERVMTNIQQMMSQVTPTIRDIREMLNAAPILSKYAMDEMERQGISGVTSMDWLKNQTNIMTVLERFMAENPALMSMQARGIVSRSKTQFYATLAENPNWLNIATSYEEVMGLAAKALSQLLSNFTSSSAITESIERFNTLLRNAPGLIDAFADHIDGWLSKLSGFLGFDYNPKETDQRVKEREAIRSFINTNLGDIRALYESYDVTPEKNDVAFASKVYRSLSSFGDLSQFATYTPESTRYVKSHSGGTYRSFVPSFATARPFDIYDALRSNLGLYGSENKVTNLFGGSNTLFTGDDIGGYGRDRKALIINFNDAIVKWDSTIESSQPQDVVNEVADNIEGIASRAIQVALLGASQKMTTRF